MCECTGAWEIKRVGVEQWAKSRNGADEIVNQDPRMELGTEDHVRM